MKLSPVTLNPVRAVIVDDEEDSRRVLEIILTEDCCNVEIVGLYDSPIEALKAIKEKDIDLIFLDINMPFINGFEFLKLAPKGNYEVIFVTAHDEFAIDAVKANVSDYLLKPITSESLQDAVERVRRNMIERERTGNLPSKISFSTLDGLEIVDVTKIEYVQAEGEYCRLHLSDQSELLVSKKLGTVEDRLKSHAFYRVHKSFLVNLKQTQKFIKANNGTLVMNSEKKIPISRSKKKEVMDIFRNPEQWS